MVLWPGKFSTDLNGTDGLDLEIFWYFEYEIKLSMHLPIHNSCINVPF